MNKPIYTNDSNLIALCRNRKQEGNTSRFMHVFVLLRHYDFKIHLHVLVAVSRSHMKMFTVSY